MYVSKIITLVCECVHQLLYILIGKRWEFVWGEGSKNYSEEVIRSYLCRHGSVVQRKKNDQQLSVTNLAAIHAGGSSGNKNRSSLRFGIKVRDSLINSKF